VVPVDIPKSGVVTHRLVWIHAEVRTVFALAVGVAVWAADEGLIEPVEPLCGNEPFVATRSASHASETLEVDCSLDHASTLARSTDSFVRHTARVGEAGRTPDS
jgi:hypothetical protein